MTYPTEIGPSYARGSLPNINESANDTGAYQKIDIYRGELKYIIIIKRAP